MTADDPDAAPPSAQALDDFYRELFAVYAGVFSAHAWSALLDDDFVFQQVAGNGAATHGKSAFLAQLQYLSTQAGRIVERETQRLHLQPGNPSVFESSTVGSLLDPTTARARHFAHVNEVTVCDRDGWKITRINCRDA